jgi:hypothetical protein
MAFSISAKGRTLRDDMEHAFDAQWNSNFGTIHDNKKAALKNAINAVADTIDVDTNNTHARSYTIAATLTTGSNASCSVTIS